MSPLCFDCPLPDDERDCAVCSFVDEPLTVEPKESRRQKQ